ncbi:MAG: glycosyltransferase [Omnitrophica bacterium RIFCSPHIGHO2_02_FULL_51_18]|nr:MAG: glycosyltransferase [Omnitrophica bacterium RIFCSPHIGHO2_02_FULL_51_18]
MKRPLLSIVAPVYNEEKSAGEFYRRLRTVLDANRYEAEILFVNDGSSDGSLGLLLNLQKQDSSVKIIDFSRNFGHQIAVKAGIDHAQGEAVVVIDTDLQDPPEAIPDLVAKWREGYDGVYAVRTRRRGETLFKKWTAALYYRLINRISQSPMPLDAGDFRLLSRRIADVIKEIHEKRPYVRGLVSWVGFKQTGVLIERDERFAGKTKYPTRKMLALAWNGITHFSFLPLQLSTFVGILTSIVCFIWILHTLYVGLILKVAVPGWTSIMLALLFLGSIQLITLGILGSYLARNYDETRSRPLYIVRSREGFE